MKKMILFVITSLMFGGCFGKGEDISSRVLGNTYILQKVVDGSEIDITFEKERLSGKAGVNNYFAGYKIDGQTIKVEAIGATRMMGPEVLMVQEQEYLKNLNEAKKIEVTEKGIVITTTSGVELDFDKK
ncbi:META domain-containing protein [uncultured Cetobacterium sp.]|uniref:META domain-containing protein n=1 Tax=uncultured Cetobacterium sp. TaxID=527638 RepID=UPI002617FCDC|nr:META domain-containing protein [uncultured Cetobacterium sp.]